MLEKLLQVLESIGYKVTVCGMGIYAIADAGMLYINNIAIDGFIIDGNICVFVDHNFIPIKSININAIKDIIVDCKTITLIGADKDITFTYCNKFREK